MPTTVGPFSNVPAPGDPVQSAWANQLTTYAVAGPRGVVGYAESTVAQSGVTAAADVTGLSVTWTAVAGHRYLIVGMVGVIQNVAAGVVNIYLTDAANAVAAQSVFSLGGGAYGTLNVIRMVAPAAGAKTYKLRFGTNAGNVSTFHGATSPGVLVVQDVGT